MKTSHIVAHTFLVHAIVNVTLFKDPTDKIFLFRASVFVDPFTEVDEQLAKERAEELAKNREKEGRWKH